jgi:hypothetical protein
VRLSAIGIDDGSPAPLTPGTEHFAANLEGVEVLRLICNLGHQRAIAVGSRKLHSATRMMPSS